MGWRHRIGSVSPMAGKISMGARREVVSAVAERYRSAKRAEKGRILDELSDNGLASQACGARAPAARDCYAGRGSGTARTPAQIRGDDQRGADGAGGSVRAGMRQAAQGDDPDLAAGT